MIDGQENKVTFIFAHGAGAGMDHPFMETIATGLAKQGIKVVRFDFPYMVRQKELGKRRPPDRAPKLLEAFSDVIAKYAQNGKVVIGGKSMGGRMASLLADHKQVSAIACLGFPFHPPGKPENFKGSHLATIEKACLILQGERDAFGTRSELDEITFSQSVRLEFIIDGDHSFKPRKSSPVSEQQNLAHAVRLLSHFIHEVYDEK
jgi:uncharacterized protein